MKDYIKDDINGKFIYIFGIPLVNLNDINKRNFFIFNKSVASDILVFGSYI